MPCSRVRDWVIQTVLNQYSAILLCNGLFFVNPVFHKSQPTLLIPDFNCVRFFIGLGLTITLDYSESFLCKSVQLYFSIVIGNKVKCVLRILPSASGLRLFTNQQILRLSNEAFFLFWIWGVQLSIIETFCPTDWSSHIAFCEAKRFELLFQAAGVLLPIKVNDCLHSICHSLRSRNWLEWVFSTPVFAPS